MCLTIIRKTKLKTIYNQLQYLSSEKNKVIEVLSKIIDGKNSDLCVEDIKSELINNLLIINKKMSDLVLVHERNMWISNGLSKFTSIILNYDNLDQLYNAIISELVKYTNTKLGVLYLIDEIDGEQQIVPVSTYAHHDRKFMDWKFNIGQGLVGQSIWDKEKIFLENVPVDYFKISSGLGEDTARCLLIVPLMSGAEVIGAIELASFSTLQSYKIEFVESIAKDISPAILSLKNNQLTKSLLKKAEESEQQLKAKEAILKQNVEKLKFLKTELENETKLKEENNQKIEEMKIMEQRLLESKLASQKKIYDTIINRLKSKLNQKEEI